MRYHVKSDNSVKEFGKKFKIDHYKKVLIYVYSENCHYCDVFDDTWKQLVAANTSDTVLVKLEIGALSKIQKTNPIVFDIVSKMFVNHSGVPNIAKYNTNTHRTHPFRGERSLSALYAFIK